MVKRQDSKTIRISKITYKIIERLCVRDSRTIKAVVDLGIRYYREAMNVKDANDKAILTGFCRKYKTHAE